MFPNIASDAAKAGSCIPRRIYILHGDANFCFEGSFMNFNKLLSFQAPVYAALALAFASFGDAFLYPFLPLHGDSLGMSAAWIGILLSINRFARIFANTIIARACANYGFRLMTIIAVGVAVFSTIGYGLVTGVAGWMLFRISWGLSYSVLRISAISYALDHERPCAPFHVHEALDA